jgi:hypothetical protein
VSKALAVLLAALAVWASAAPAATPRRVSLQQLARNLVKAGAPGAIVYVRTPTATRSGAAGFADRTAHVTMRAVDRYRIASVTKAYVAVVVLQLEAEGRLDIDDRSSGGCRGSFPTAAQSRCASCSATRAGFTTTRTRTASSNGSSRTRVAPGRRASSSPSRSHTRRSSLPVRTGATRVRTTSCSASSSRP